MDNFLLPTIIGGLNFEKEENDLMPAKTFLKMIQIDIANNFWSGIPIREILK